LRKKQLKLFKYSILILFLWNCKESKFSYESKFEQAVLYEIFPAIIDSIYFESRLTPPPPPPESFFDKEEYKNNIDKAIKDYRQSSKFKKDIKEWKRKKDSLKRDKSSIFIVVFDTVKGFEPEDLNKLSKHFQIENINLDSLNFMSGKEFRINLSRLKSNNEKIKFKYFSESPSGREFWRAKYDFFIAAKIEFSKILFDKTKTYGVLNVGYNSGILNGKGFRIFIKKNEKGAWRIDKIDATWIS